MRETLVWISVHFGKSVSRIQNIHFECPVFQSTISNPLVLSPFSSKFLWSLVSACFWRLPFRCLTGVPSALLSRSLVESKPSSSLPATNHFNIVAHNGEITGSGLCRGVTDHSRKYIYCEYIVNWPAIWASPAWSSSSVLPLLSVSVFCSSSTSSAIITVSVRHNNHWYTTIQPES